MSDQQQNGLAWGAGLLIILGGLTGLAIQLTAVAGPAPFKCVLAFGAGCLGVVTITRVQLWFVKLVRKAIQAATEETGE